MIRESMKGEKFEVLYEQVYTSDSGNSIIIPILKSSGNILIQVSGGMDSALLLYLLVKTIKEKNLNIKVIPISLEVTTKLKSLHLTEKILNYVSSAFDYQFNNIVQHIIPEEDCAPDKKDLFFKKIVDSAKIIFTPQIEFNGDTKNPPENIRNKFRNDANRRFDRDNKSSVYISNDCASPLGLVDKHDIVYFYKHFNLLESLAPLTMSCDENLLKIQQQSLDMPCQKCWWCQERAYGFISNGLTEEDAFRHYK